MNEKGLKDKKNSYLKPVKIVGSIILIIVFSVIFCKSGDKAKHDGGISSQILDVDQAQNSLSAQHVAISDKFLESSENLVSDSKEILSSNSNLMLTGDALIEDYMKLWGEYAEAMKGCSTLHEKVSPDFYNNLNVIEKMFKAILKLPSTFPELLGEEAKWAYNAALSWTEFEYDTIHKIPATWQDFEKTLEKTTKDMQKLAVPTSAKLILIYSPSTT